MEDIEYKYSNREKSMRPKLGKFWCWKCDANLVTVGARCKKCGAKAGKYHIKKEGK